MGSTRASALVEQGPDPDQRGPVREGGPTLRGAPGGGTEGGTGGPGSCQSTDMRIK
jgi:hypothetical protein